MQLTNPLAGNAPFPNNQIPLSAINPVAVTVATKYLPIASADECGKVNYAIPATGDEDEFIGRIDFVQSEKNTIFGRYFVDAFKNPPTYDGKNLLTTTQAGNLEMAQSLTIGDNYTLGPRTLNSFHFTFNRRCDDRGPTDVPINPTLLGVNMYSARRRTSCCWRPPGLQYVLWNLRPRTFNGNSFQVADDLDFIRGPASNVLRVQRGPSPEQYHLRIPGKWKLRVQRFPDRPLSRARFHDWSPQ